MIVAQQYRHLARAAFTLMEMLAVVAILVVLACIGSYYYVWHRDDTKRDEARLQVKKLTQAVDAYYAEHGEYPPSLTTLTEAGADGSKPALDAAALKTPWGGTYQYDASGARNGSQRPRIWADAPGGMRISIEIRNRP